MKTKHKIAIAKFAYHSLHLARGLVGGGDVVTVKRRGLCYELDLSEGIDLAIYLQGQFEPTTARACARLVRPGQTVLDVGANIGAHTLPLARLVGPEGRVIAFEPTQYAITKLSRNLALNPEIASRVMALHCFLGATDRAEAPQAVYSSWPLIDRPMLHPLHGGQQTATRGAAFHALDDILGQHGCDRVDFVKMDVDGNECEVLAGARRMLARDRPVFVMELAPYLLTERGHAFADLLGFFVPLGYRFYRESDNAALPETAAGIEALVRTGESQNVIAKVSV